jgi:quercetin 2,3-dioxygenase
MPAVTVDDPSMLPVIEPPGAGGGTPRPVAGITDAPLGYEGEGFPVRRAFAGVDPADLDPFVHMDQMGPIEYGPGEPKGTGWHPHRGFETVTYLLDGAMQHQDTAGGGGLITDGATQWMTAGSGLLHIETPPAELVRTGGPFHGIQLWVNLPASKKSLPPRYQGISADAVTLLRSPDTKVLVRLIAGELGGHQGPGGTNTPILVAHATLQPGGHLTLPWPPAYNALAYALTGRGTVGEEARQLHEGQLARFGPGGALTLAADDGADAPGLDVLLLGGEPIREPVVWYGPFVMNTKAEIDQAMTDFQSGRMGTIPAGALGT